ncbi:hypothetical protein [Streptomyces griseorubiginosus]|uniref:hypothetical protein n=1 Tax=Streptomyces griseorubiginosus TaxID=67304 RepID=UPI0033D23EE4
MTRTTTKKTTTNAPAPAAKKTTAKRTPAKPRTPRARTRKATSPALSLVKSRPDLPTRDLPFMTDAQGYATLAALIVGITTPNIRDWRDHRNNTCTRKLRDGSLLHYNLDTRTLTWQAVCRMGATHQYELDSRSMACAARVHADACKTLHADLSTVPPLTADELADLGLLHTPTWAQKVPGDEPITETIPVPLPTPAPEPRALGDELTHSANGVADTQPMSTSAIAAHIASQLADADVPKEHPQP